MDMRQGIGDGVGLNSDIGVDEEDPLALGLAATKVSGRGWSTSDSSGKEADSEFLSNLGGGVGGCIVDNKDFVRYGNGSL